MKKVTPVPVWPSHFAADRKISALDVIDARLKRRRRRSGELDSAAIRAGGKGRGVSAGNRTKAGAWKALAAAPMHKWSAAAAAPLMGLLHAVRVSTRRHLDTTHGNQAGHRDRAAPDHVDRVRGVRIGYDIA